MVASCQCCSPSSAVMTSSVGMGLRFHSTSMTTDSASVMDTGGCTMTYLPFTAVNGRYNYICKRVKRLPSAGDFGLHQAREVLERLLPAEVARFDRDRVGQILLHHVHLGADGHLAE